MSYDKYVYPGTNVLVNKLGITDAKKLDGAERESASSKMLSLRKAGVTGRFDTEHLKALHKYIFGDVYDWAGEFRDIQIWKGGTEFAAPEDIEKKLDALCGRIREAGYFRDMDHDATANSLAGLMSDLNRIHPFREGNGRTQRAFIGQLAINAGYNLNFTGMSENDMRNASMAAARGNTNLMAYLFRENLSDRIYEPGPVRVEKPVKQGPMARLLSFLNRGDDGNDGNGGPSGPGE